jgi:hypothetical protein
MEWWSFELLVLLSGLLPNPKLETAVMSIWCAESLARSPLKYYLHYCCLQYSLIPGLAY